MGPLIGVWIAVLGNHLWPEPGTEQAVGWANNLVYHVQVRPAVLRGTPAWPDGRDPPLSPLKAMLLADAKREKLVQDSAEDKWEMDRAALYPALGGDRWYYEFTYYAHFQGAAASGPRPSLSLIVLMDGTVPDPVVWKRADWMRAMEAGAFRPRSPPPRAVAPKAGPPPGLADAGGEARLWEAARHLLDRWAARAELYYRIAVAPKLVYGLDKLAVYRDGVWAEFSVTNPGPDRTYLATHWVVPPVSFRDRSGREWAAPKFDGCVLFGPPDAFVAVPAGGTVRFRSRLSIARGPLEPVGLAKRPAPARPAELAYVVAGWRTAYARLTDRGQARSSVFAVGSGQVAVKWSDKAAPKAWGLTTLVSGDGD